MQDRIKRDPTSYVDEFDLQVRSSCSRTLLVFTCCISSAASKLPGGAGAVQAEACRGLRNLPRPHNLPGTCRALLPDGPRPFGAHFLMDACLLRDSLRV